MRIHIRHEITHVFEPPVRFLNAVLRLTPRSHESQHVVRWRVEIDGDSRIRAFDDGYGNCMHTLSMTGPTGGLRILAEGVVDTFDAAGIVRATVERFPPELFLRETTLTETEERLQALAAAMPAGSMIDRLHALLLTIGQKSGASQDAQSQRQSDANQRQASGDDPLEFGKDGKARETAKSLAHDFIVCARLIGAPARFVSGYYVDPKSTAGGAHFWAEAHVEGVGWIGFDPANAICPHESHVRMAIGLDALDAAFVRAAPGSQSAAEILDVRQHS